MKVAYVTIADPTDLHHWSGLNFFIRRSLEVNGVEVILVGPLRTPFEHLYKVKQAFYTFIRRKRHHRQFEPGLMRAWGRVLKPLIEEIKPDVVVAPGSHHVLGLETDVPVVIIADANFACAHDYYSWYTNLDKANVRDGHRMSRLSLERSAATVYSSQWAANAAISHYGIAPEKVHVVPFGANLLAPPSSQEVEQFIDQRPASPCRLLFLGVEWHRKGGDVAVDIARELNDAGLPTELHVVGCQPDISEPLPNFVHAHGFISKSTKEGRARLKELISNAHFLTLPSRAEAYGLAYCEASAYGVPSLARRTGGVPVRNGVNGWAFEPGEGPELFAAYVQTLMQDPAAYRAAARSARREFEERLNWDTAGRSIKAILENVVNRQ